MKCVTSNNESFHVACNLRQFAVMILEGLVWNVQHYFMVVVA